MLTIAIRDRFICGIRPGIVSRWTSFDVAGLHRDWCYSVLYYAGLR